MKRSLALILLLGLMTVVLLGCMGQPPEPRSLEENLRLGKYWLQQNYGSKAYIYFKEALDEDPDNKEALYGIVLALDLRVFAFIDGIIDLVTGPIISNVPKETCEKACQRIDECNVYRETWTTPESCMSECPFGLQEMMFETLIDGSSCERIRDYGLDWITPTKPERCVELCNDFDACGLINPPVTFTVEECIDHCPWSYVHHHEKSYKVGTCEGYDRTAFEHITKGLQVLFRNIGIFIPPETEEYTQKLFDMNTDYEYMLRFYKWTLVSPPLEWDLSGRYGYAELYMSRALSHLFQTFLLLATSVNLEMNFPSFDLNMNYPDPSGFGEILHNLIRVVEILLYDPVFPLGFQIYDEQWAYDQVAEGATEFGAMWEAVADMFEYLYDDADVQEGRSVGYNDDNNNFHWDENETITFRIGDDGIDLTKQQTYALVDIARAMQDNFYNREPFKIELLTEFLDASGLGGIDWVIDLLAAWCPNGEVDLSTPLYEATENGFRDFLATLLEKMRTLESVLVANGVI